MAALAGPLIGAGTTFLLNEAFGSNPQPSDFGSSPSLLSPEELAPFLGTLPSVNPVTPSPIGGTISVPPVNEFFAPVRISTDDFLIRARGGAVSLNVDSEKEEDLDDVLGQLDDLFATLGPGFDQVLESALANLDAERQRTIGNMRDDFVRRRVAGSSFAEDTISRSEAEFALKKGQLTSEVFLAELETKTQILQAQSQILNSQLDRELAQANLALETLQTSGEIGTRRAELSVEAQIAELEAQTRIQTANIQAEIAELEQTVDLINGLQAANSGNAATATDLAIAEAEGEGELFGTIGGAVGDIFNEESPTTPTSIPGPEGPANTPGSVRNTLPRTTGSLV